MFKYNAQVMKFLPDLNWKKKLLNREYVLNIISSLKPNYLRKAIETAETLHQV